MALERLNPNNNPLLREPNFFLDRALPVLSSSVAFGIILHADLHWTLSLIGFVAILTALTCANMNLIRWQKTADLASDKMVTGNLTKDDTARITRDPADLPGRF